MKTHIYKLSDGYSVALIDSDGYTLVTWNDIETERQAEALAEGLLERAKKDNEEKLKPTVRIHRVRDGFHVEARDKDGKILASEHTHDAKVALDMKGRMEALHGKLRL